MSKDNSSFGKGYSYCLGLFLAHAERMQQYKQTEKIFKTTDGPTIWFNSAADHLIELEIPVTLSKKKQLEIEKFRNKCLDNKTEVCSWKDVTEAIDKAKILLLEWDKHNKIKSIQADWS